MTNDKNEKQLICSLIDYLESNNTYDFIAREVPFGFGKRRADLLACSYKLEETYAYEIKSDIDTLQRLGVQLEDYRKTFNYVYVVTTAKFYNKVRDFGLWFGIILVQESGELSIARNARKRNKLNNAHLLSSMSASRVKNNTSMLTNKIFIEWLCKRYTPLYQLFSKEKNLHGTTEKDIKILSLRSDTVRSII